LSGLAKQDKNEVILQIISGIRCKFVDGTNVRDTCRLVGLAKVRRVFLR